MVRGWRAAGVFKKKIEKMLCNRFEKSMISTNSKGGPIMAKEKKEKLEVVNLSVEELQSMVDGAVELLPQNMLKKYMTVVDDLRLKGMIQWKMLADFIASKTNLKVSARMVRDAYYGIYPEKKPIQKAEKGQKQQRKKDGMVNA
jgi:hypothetical protein